MKTKLLALGLGALLGSAAHAEVLTFSYTALVQKTEVAQQQVPSIAVNGGWAPGNTFHGTFTIDLDTPFYNSSGGWSDPNYGEYRGPGANVATVKADHSSYQFVSEPDTTPYLTFYYVSNGSAPFGDYVQYYSATSYSTGEFAAFYFVLDDATGQLVSSGARPKQLDFSKVSHNQVSFFYTDRDGVFYEVSGVLTSLQAAPVPEPATVGMLGAGLLLVGAQVRRRRRGASAQ